MKTCMVVRHVAFEDLGGFAPILEAFGFSNRSIEAGIDDFTALDPLADDLLIVLGGPIGVYEVDRYPFLEAEIAFIGRRLQAGRPVIGICLGAQLMAAALGARVYPNPAGKEIGWGCLELTSEGKRELAELANVPVLHWHGDTFDLPDGATLLASTTLARHQAFTWGKAALGLQFHPEVTRAGLERWFIGHACEIAAACGIDVNSLRAETARQGAAVEKKGVELLTSWLQRIYGKPVPDQGLRS